MRVSLTVTLTAAIALAVSGCGDGGTTVRAEGNAAAGTTAETTETATPEPTDLAPTAIVQPTESFAPFTGPGVDKFGQDAVRGAYIWATRYAVENTFDDNLIRKSNDEVRAVDFTGVVDGLTPSAAETYRKLVTELEAKGSDVDQDTVADIASLATWGVQTNGYELRQPASRDTGFGGATTVDADTDKGRDRLILSFPVSGEILLIDTQGVAGPAGGPVYADFRKNMTLFLVKSDDPGTPWKIDAWETDIEIGEVTPDPKA